MWRDWLKLLPFLGISAKARLDWLIKKTEGSCRKVLEVSNSPWIKGVSIMTKISPPLLYIARKPYFWRHPSIAMKFPSLGSCQGGVEPPAHQHQFQGRRRVKGPLPERAATAPPGVAASRGLRHGDFHHHLLNELHLLIKTLSTIFIYPFLISWQTWCVIQSIIFPWSIVLLCLCLSSDLLLAILR
jgi:hypothetical protein